MNTADDKTETSNKATSATGWTERLARHRTGLAALSFSESTVVPIPLETLVVPLMVGHPKRAVTIASAIWVGCMFGAAVLYAVGLWLAEPVVQPAMAFLGFSDSFAQMEDRLSGDSLFWTVFVVSFSPVPMQFATLGAGAVGGNFGTTMIAIALSRGLRYFGLAVLAQFVGERLARFKIPTGRLVLGICVLLVAGWVLRGVLS